MRVFQVEGDWSREHLKLGTRPEPHAGRGQVRLKMLAAALNFRDLIVPNKGYGSRMQALPLLMLSDGVGIIDEVGEGVSGWQTGQRVCPNLLQSWAASHRPPSIAFDAGVKWLGLDVRAHRVTGEATAEVEFVARQKPLSGPAVRLHERSRFVLEAGQWLYVDGDQL